jgi:hypothetical protein
MPGPTSATVAAAHDGSTWTEYPPIDLTYDGNYASITATGLSGYAMVAASEPGTLALLAAGVLGVLVYARRKLRQPLGIGPFDG